MTPFGRKFGDMSRKLIWKRNHRDTMPDRAKAVAEYERHIADVKATVPPEKLLVFTVDQGWEPLCAFLGVPVPDTPFPNVNDRAEIQKAIGDMTKAAYVFLAGGAVVAAAVIYGLVRLIGG